MEIQIQDTVADTLTQNIGADAIFGKYNIDFCCGGGLSLAQACKENGVDFEVLKKEIEAVKNTISSDVRFDDYSMEDAIGFVENKHHQFFLEQLPVLSQYAIKVAQVHGESHAEVVEVNAVFMQLSTMLKACIQFDLNVLYPKLKALSAHLDLRTAREEVSILKVNLASTFKKAGVLSKELSSLTDKYKAPEGACMTYQTLYSMLKQLEQQLHQYMHFEMNVLFSKI